MHMHILAAHRVTHGFGAILCLFVHYDFLDHSRNWKPHAQRGSRSLMNVTFRGDSKDREEAMLAAAEARGLSGLRGHRSVGGLRASLYNAFPEQGVHQLVELLAEHDR